MSIEATEVGSLREEVAQALEGQYGSHCPRCEEQVADHHYAAEAAIAIVVERCAEVAEDIAKDWREKEQSYREMGNDGPYLGVPNGYSIAKRIRSLSKEPTQ